MNEATVLTNRERREDVAFLAQAHLATEHEPVQVLSEEECKLFAADPSVRSLLFYRLLCYGALAAQPSPEAVIEADWRRMEASGVVEDLFSGEFSIELYALNPPVSRSDSKGKIVDFIRLAESREIWEKLLPEPADPEVVVDVLHVASGGALKSRAFWVVREMRRCGLWRNEALDRFACVPDGRIRKRATRMGLVDLPEKADTFADMKAVSRALFAVLRLGESPEEAFDLPVATAAQRCEICDEARMASCALPHCRWRREHTESVER